MVANSFFQLSKYYMNLMFVLIFKVDSREVCHGANAFQLTTKNL